MKIRQHKTLYFQWRTLLATWVSSKRKLHQLIHMPQKRGDNEILAHFIPEIKTKDHDVIGVNVIPLQVNEIPRKRTE